MDTSDTGGTRVRINFSRVDNDRGDIERVDTDRVSFTMSCSDIEEVKDIAKKLHAPTPHIFRALVKCGILYYQDNVGKQWIGWDEETQEPIEREGWQQDAREFKRYGFIR